MRLASKRPVSFRVQRGDMMGKNDIIQAWIMMERLSEGDISGRDKGMKRFDRLQGDQFHALFCKELQSKFATKSRTAKAGIILYMDIFNFKETADILKRTLPQRSRYNAGGQGNALRDHDIEEDIEYRDKFSFALCFDTELNFKDDLFFVTESGYIRYFQKLPEIEEF